MTSHLDTLPPGFVLCADCGQRAFRTGPSQRYCRDCSSRRDRTRKSAWAREHPQPAEDAAPARQARTTRRRAKGIATSAATPSRRGSTPTLAWRAEVDMPFAWAASKNHVWSMAGSHVYSRKESVDYRQALTALVRAAAEGRAVPGRIWLDIFVQKPNHRGDAVNVVDLVCDAVKDALGVDDRWVSLLRLDWEIRKANPRLFVAFGQESTEPQQICALCGRDLPLGAFGSHGDKPGRECRECRRTGPA